MKALHIGGFAGLLLVVGILTGCSLFLSSDEVVQKDLAVMDSSTWLIAAQGQGGPPNCVKDLPPSQAKKLAEKALKDKREIQLLKQALERRGKKLVLSKAHGCKVKGKARGQGLSAQQESPDLTLIEVPAGSDAALYLLENEPAQESNSWAAMVGVDEGGQWLTQLEVGLEEEVTSSEEPVGVDLFLPDEIGTQEIASQVQPLLSTTAGSQGVSAQELDWSQAQVVILNADLDEATALVVVPEVGATTGQALLPGGMSFDLDRAVHTAVKVQRVSTGGTSGSKWQILPEPVPQLPVIKPVPKPTPTPPKLPAPKPAPPSPPPLPPAPVVIKGIELPKPMLPYCPAPYMGPASAVSRLQCMDYDERWYEKTWENQTRPSLFNGVAQASTQVTQALNKPGIAFFPDPRMSVLLAGFQNVNLQTVQRLRELALKGDFPNPTSGVSATGVSAGCVSVSLGFEFGFFFGLSIVSADFCIADLLDLIASFQAVMSALGPQALDELVAALADGRNWVQTNCPTASSCDLNRFIHEYLNTHPVTDPLINAIAAYICELEGGTATFDAHSISCQGAAAPAINNTSAFLLHFFLQFADKPSEMDLLIRSLGAVAVVGVAMLDNNKPSQDPRLGAFPYADGTSLFEAIAGLLQYATDHQQYPLLLTDLQNLAAMTVFAGAGGLSDNFYRFEDTIQLAIKLVDQGWDLVRLEYDLTNDYLGGICIVGQNCTFHQQVDIIATGTFNGRKVVSYVLVQPFLSTVDASAKGDLILRLSNTIRSLVTKVFAGAADSQFSSLKGAIPYIFIVIHSCEAESLASLEDQIQQVINGQAAPVTVAVVLNGQVVYAAGANEIDAPGVCQSMGICTSAQVVSAVCSPPPTNGSLPPDSGQGVEEEPAIIGGIGPRICSDNTPMQQVCIQGLSWKR